MITITPSDGINKGNPQTVTITVAPPPPPKRLLNDTGVNFSGYSAHSYFYYAETLRDGSIAGGYTLPQTPVDATDCIGIAALNLTASARNSDGAPQDCDQGRDSVANLSKIGAGEAGFDFTKLGRNGQVLAIQNASYAANGQESLGTQWSCVRDNHTGFVWEVKTLDSSMHNRDRLFATYDPDTYHVTQLLEAANSGSGLCGFKDWRVPNFDELSNIVLRKMIPGNNSPAIDTDFFPNTNTQSGEYRSASSFAPPPLSIPHRRAQGAQLTMRFVGSGPRRSSRSRNNPSFFVGGTPHSAVGSEELPVRLVRGAPALRQTSNARYVINGDGTVTDQVTQLMWQRCRHGRSGADCTTSTVTDNRAALIATSGSVDFGWRETLRAAASSTVGGFSDWRVPNFNELVSLVDFHSHSVNSSAFPNLFDGLSLGGMFHSSSPVASYLGLIPRGAGGSGGDDVQVLGWNIGYWRVVSTSPLRTIFTPQTMRRGAYLFSRDDPSQDPLRVFNSNGGQAIFVRDIGTPPSPSPLVAPGGLRATADDSQVRVSWTAVTGAKGYGIYYSQSSLSATSPGDSPGVTRLELFTAPTSSNPFTVYELTNEKRYYFRVTAIGADNAESAPSSQDSALPSKYPRLRTVER